MKVKLLERGQRQERLGQGGEPVVVEVELLESSQLSERLWQRRKLVVVKVKSLESGELSDRFREGCEPQPAQVQPIAAPLMRRGDSRFRNCFLSLLARGHGGQRVKDGG